MSPRWFFALAALAMTADAVGYSIGAIRKIENGLAPGGPYWRRRLRLNLLLANHGLYLAAVVAWLAVALFHAAPTASALLAIVALLSALYSVVTVLAFTRQDAAHAVPRAIAFAGYTAGFMLAALPPVPPSVPHAV